MRRMLFWSLLAAMPCAAQHERMAALHETVVSAVESGGDVGLFTYDHDPGHWLDFLALGKLQVGLETGAGTVWLAAATPRIVRNHGGGEGIEVLADIAGVSVHLEALPTDAGRDNGEWEGAAVFRVRAEPAARLVLRWGGVGRVRIHGFRPAISRVDYLLQPDLLPPEAAASRIAVEGAGALVVTPDLPAVAVRIGGCGEVSTEGGLVTARSAAPVSLATVVAAFAPEPERARALAAVDVAATEAACRRRFRELLSSASIETPEPALDATFRAALVNLEYGWRAPIGWIESIHHWGTFWTMQHALAADWIGQTGRSRDMLLYHAAHLMPSGQVPDMDPSGRARVDFGGWNQFYVWAVEHYWKQTGDLDFLRRIEEPLKRVVDQTFASGDADGNGLLGFGQQIGNQEDYVSTPNDGTSPTIAGIEMLRIRAEVARALGKSDEAEELRARARQITGRLRQDLYRPDLGRFMYYRDTLGVEHLEGQYHTYIWPVLYHILSGPEAWLSMQHVADTLTGDEGQIYTSNNFPRHVNATVGSQAGGQQQPWATLGWAALGDGERAVKPLRYIAKYVSGDVCRGSWPEVAEDYPAYFTPPAGVYVWGVIEGLFGLKMDRPNNMLTASPCLPPGWSRARLVTPEVTMTVKQEANRRVIWVRCTRPTKVVVRHVVPITATVRIVGNGEERRVDEPGGVGHGWAGWGSREPVREATVVADWSTDGRHLVASPGSEPVVIAHRGVRLGGVLDPQGALEFGPTPSPGTEYWAATDDRRALGRDFGEPGRRCLGDRFAFQAFGTFGADRPAQWVPVNVSEAGFRGRYHPSRATIEYVADRPMLRLREGTDSPPSQWLRLRLGEHQTRFAAPGEPPERLLRPDGDGYGDQVQVPVPDEVRPWLSPGRMPLEIADSWRSWLGQMDVSPLIARDDDLRALALARCDAVALPADLLADDDGWRTWRPWLAYGHQPWASLRPPLEGLDETADILPETAPGLRFANPGGKLLPVSRALGRPSVTIPLSGRASRAYLLVVPMLENHDSYSPVGRLTVRCGDGTDWSRTLHFPGDLHWWGPRNRIGDFATHDTDWCDSLRFLAPEAVMNILEVDLGGWRPVESLTIETIGTAPCLAVAAVTVFAEPTPTELAALSSRARGMAEQCPRRLFGFDQPTLDGWETAGDAWGIRDTADDPWQRRGSSRWFADSLADSEQATGTIISVPFEVTGSRLVFRVDGHGARNYVALVDAETGEELRRAGAPGHTGAFQSVTWDVAGLRGRRVRFIAVDAEDGAAYAWIAFDDIVLEP